MNEYHTVSSSVTQQQQTLLTLSASKKVCLFVDYVCSGQSKQVVFMFKHQYQSDYQMLVPRFQSIMN